MALGSNEPLTEMITRSISLGVDSVPNRNEYQKYFLGGKGGRCLRMTTLQSSCAVVIKSENLNFLEPSGPLQACKGTTLPFYMNHWIKTETHDNISKMSVSEEIGRRRRERIILRRILPRTY